MGELRLPKQQPYHTGNALLGGEGALDIHLIYYLEPRAVSRPRFHEEWWFPHLHVCIISSGTLFNKSYHKDSHLIFQMKENEKKYFLYFFKNKAMKTQVELAIIKKVREYRLAAGMSQAQLSMEMNLDITFVGNVESAKCKDKYNFNHLNALAIIFNCKMKDFMPDENFPDDNSKYLKRDK